MGVKSLSKQLNISLISRMILVIVAILIVNFIVLLVSLNLKLKNYAKSKAEFISVYLNETADAGDLQCFTASKQVSIIRELTSALFFTPHEGLLLYSTADSSLLKVKGDLMHETVYPICAKPENPEFISATNDVIFIENDILTFIKSYHACAIPIGKPPVYLVYYYYSDKNMQFLGHYPVILTLFITMLVVVVSWSIYRFNKKISKPYADILKLIEYNQDVRIAFSNTKDEPMIIRRAIDLYQSQLVFYRKNLEKASSQSMKIEKDIRIAKRLQKNMLPKETEVSDRMGHVVINAKTDTFFDIGGDLYDHYMLDDTHLLFLIGDVSGKGIPAALFMIYIQTLLRTIVAKDNNPGSILTRLNEKVLEENVSDLFVTIFVGVLNCNTHELLYSNAAHNLPLLVESSGKIEELGQTHGIPVGIYENKIYSFSRIKLKASSLVVLYTDGVTDMLDENGMEYSVDTLKYNLLGSWFLTPCEVVDKIKGSVELFRGNSPKVDDMTIMVLKVDK